MNLLITLEVKHVYLYFSSLNFFKKNNKNENKKNSCINVIQDKISNYIPKLNYNVKKKNMFNNKKFNHI